MNSLTSHASADVTLKYFDGKLGEGTPSDSVMKIAICDVETTGLDNANDEVIELGCCVIEVDKSTYEFVKVTEEYNELNQPSKSIPPEVVKVTGITDADVAGKVLDIGRLSTILNDVDMIVCHNARFDRPFLERVLPELSNKPFACSLMEIYWKRYGFAGAALGVIMMEMGHIGTAHRALGDCMMTAKVLLEKNELEGGDGRPFLAELMDRASGSSVFVKAINSPFEEKDILKKAMFRWNGASKFWGKELPAANAEVLQGELEKNGFTGKLEIVSEITAKDRYRL